MKCPECNEETKYSIETSTLVGYRPLLINGLEHNHDDNCLKREYICINGHEWVESIISNCSINGCNWHGKISCFCHKANKVENWSDPKDYHLTKSEYYRLLHKFDRLIGGQYYDTETNTIVDLNT